MHACMHAMHVQAKQARPHKISKHLAYLKLQAAPMANPNWSTNEH